MHFEESIIYQFYPLGTCGASEYNRWDNANTWNGAARPDENRIGRLAGWIPHLKKLGVTAVYFSPVFQSDAHGYDTRDYYTIDGRLGSNEDFAAVCRSLHEQHIAVILDGVFNHTGRGFWAFRDIQRNKRRSPYADWYTIDWNGNSPFNDGFAYEGWEGCMDLVKLNLQNPAVIEHIFGAIRKWSELFGIDGLRLDVAYSLDPSFLRKLNRFCKTLPSIFGDGSFALIGETIHSSDYALVRNDGCDSCTNYELYKGVYSSLNDVNLFELAHSLNRQFGSDGVFRDKNLVTFTDNHDVSRFASIINEKRRIAAGYALLFTMPGIPCLYYGSEWGVTGDKKNGDRTLRPALSVPEWNGLTDLIAKLIRIRRAHAAFTYGSYRTLCVTNGQLVFERVHECPFSGKTERIVTAVNITDTDVPLPVKSGSPGAHGVFEGLYGTFTDLSTGAPIHGSGPVQIPAFGFFILKQS
ncbi:alpha-amylase family glycosyl hydrolase [Treponema brennaborense]|uniref:Cyclomaltodextrinase n=1 Tax=Treponema brennaborense (strain DSM 12168 / CIP 105900 / DD5/3) TaxID=906968 RepID=F4LQ29_TREBD|nr:alpha-amylase family glycosyl hydrolase [Treponema brennaborense]AEE17107.1 Cyclomaltodextrinase [Treponema brennaborense DSM 12168]